MAKEPDLFTFLENKGDVVAQGPGIYSLHGKLVQFKNSLDGEILKLASFLKAQNVEFPITISMDQLKRMKISKQISKGPGTCHRSAICLPSFPRFENRQFKVEEKVCLTSEGRVFRDEKSVQGLERLREYSMREIIFFGSPQYVQDSLKRCREWCLEWVSNNELEGTLEPATDLFFGPNKPSLEFYQKVHQSKLEFVLDIKLNTKIAVASLNNHGLHFSKAFEFKFENGDYVTTGCFGVGFERFIYAVLSQKGYDESLWPSTLRRRISGTP